MGSVVWASFGRRRFQVGLGVSLSLALLAGSGGCSTSAPAPTRTVNGSGGEGPATTSGGASGNAVASGGTMAASGGAPGSAGTASAEGGSNTAGTGAASAMAGTSSNAGASGGAGGTAVAAGGAAASEAGGSGGSAGAPVCQMASYSFVPQIPTVFVMVDRSGSMFDCLSTTTVQEPSCKTESDTAWVKLKDAVLTVIESLQGDVRFGFASFTGTDPSRGGTCPMIDEVAPDLDNFMAIKTTYDSLAFQPETTESGKKFETPARQALDHIGMELGADTYPGDKFVLFVTDGQPDYCDDANSLCAPDSVIAGLQNLKTAGVTTIVMGLQSMVNDLPPGILQAFANAGAGEPTVAPVRANQDEFAFFDQCQNVAGWQADLVTSGKTAERGVTLGTYSDTAGPTMPYTPDAADATALVDQLGAALSTVKSCSFDLGNVNGQSIKVDLNQLDQASITIEGAMVPLDPTNGWSMSSATELVLNGTACETWRMPGNDDISFNFPCKTIIFE